MKKNKRILIIIVLTIFILLISSNVFAEKITETYNEGTYIDINNQIQERLNGLGCTGSVEEAFNNAPLVESADGQSRTKTYKLEWEKDKKKYTANINMFLGQVNGQMVNEATLTIEMLDENSQTTDPDQNNEPDDYDYIGTSYQDLNQKIQNDLQIKYLATGINVEYAYRNAITLPSGEKKFTVSWETATKKTTETETEISTETITDTYQAEIKEYESNSKFYAKVSITKETHSEIIGKPINPVVGIGNAEASGQHTVDEIVGEGNKFIETGESQGSKIEAGNLKKSSDTLYNILLSLGIVIAVAVGVYLGAKFMMASAEDKAKVKESLVPYIAGCVVIFGAFIIWKLVITLFGQMG